MSPFSGWFLFADGRQWAGEWGRGMGGGEGWVGVGVRSHKRYADAGFRFISPLHTGIIHWLHCGTTDRCSLRFNISVAG